MAMKSDEIEPMYLNRLPLDEKVGVYAAHQMIASLAEGAGRTIWRRCPGYALVLSTKKLVGCDSRAYEPRPEIGRITRFDLLAEVSVARKSEKMDRGRRKDPILEERIHDPSKQYAELARTIGFKWIAAQSARCGFEIQQLDRSEYEVIEFVRKGKPIRIGAIRFTGSLKVVEPENFRQAMLKGIGHGKAWGCGLLLCVNGRLQ
jgi:CRISPR-associated protein Cas6/Cse3/CasE subtype I-E